MRENVNNTYLGRLGYVKSCLEFMIKNKIDYRLRLYRKWFKDLNKEFKRDEKTKEFNEPIFEFSFFKKPDLNKSLVRVHRLIERGKQNE